MLRTQWQGCYDEGWRGLIVEESFAHPAKYARNLIRTIYAHAVDSGYLTPGDTVVDPFGGVALGALDAMALGINWLGCELEPRFVALGNQNLELWRKYHGGASAQLIQGDSRRLCGVVESAAACIGSPPYADQSQQSGSDTPARLGVAINGCTRGGSTRYEYGTTPGQLGNLPAGSHAAAVVSSPPYGGNGKSDYLTTDDGKTRLRDMRRGYRQGAGCFRGSEAAYGDTEGQLGREHSGTFWSASRIIVEQCRSVLRPGGIAIWVTKDFVRNRQRVPFSDQWRQLCEACGFETVEWIEALLVKETRHPALFGGETVERKERKSFFRRLAEKKGSPRIDHEDVVVMRRVV